MIDCKCTERQSHPPPASLHDPSGRVTGRAGLRHEKADLLISEWQPGPKLIIFHGIFILKYRATHRK